MPLLLTSTSSLLILICHCGTAAEKSKILHVPAEYAIWYGNFSPLVAGVMVVTQYHSADPPIVLCNNIWLSGL